MSRHCVIGWRSSRALAFDCSDGASADSDFMQGCDEVTAVDLANFPDGLSLAGATAIREAGWPDARFTVIAGQSRPEQLTIGDAL